VQDQGLAPTTLAHDAVYILPDGSERLDTQGVQQQVQKSTAYSLKLRIKDILHKPELLSACERDDDETAEAIREVFWEGTEARLKAKRHTIESTVIQCYFS
jgi:6-pyruvoyl-tetrahydropterin synthase